MISGIFGATPNWQPISSDEAIRHPLYGFGGWLLLPWGLSLVGIIGNLLTIFGFLDDTLVGSASGYDGLGAAKLGAILAALLIMPFMILAPMKDPRMPDITIKCLWAILGIQFLASLITFGVGTALLSGLIGAVQAGLVTLYLRRSVRVGVTYLSRIAAPQV
jgi:hypothetical protein